MKKRSHTSCRFGSFVAAIALLTLVGCSEVPGYGPSAYQVETAMSQQDKRVLDYVMLDVDVPTVQHLSKYADNLPPKEFRVAKGKRSAIRVGVGDQLSVGIWESITDGLFSTQGQKRTELALVVDDEGQIFVPYVGELDVENKTISQVRKQIMAGLKGKAVDPQVVVNLQANGSHQVVVIGDVARSGQYRVHEDGLSLVEVISEAGGTRHPDYETKITVVRDKSKFRFGLDDLAEQTANNIWLQPRDIVSVSHQPKSFTVFGAVVQRKKQNFPASRVSLSEAIGMSGGLHDGTADASGVFLFRFEDRQKMMPLLPPQEQHNEFKTVPIVYRINLQEPSGLFLTQAFEIKDKDVIYVANASVSEINKFISILVSPVTGTLRTGVALAAFP
ncbi:polysaccharide biosynthesis/export family protein [Pseudovibrio sp. Tun.PSC04-5.I4]|uniref:polysaccharide biosynthesis/export family protein n=1 Tax=Pseudovibrio sp. Tun.PSC04-5.I4 TaxID=1798213 RepID=UPI00088A273C|nr:polysaccharide biosynthesis/export family protein [Pseudovibrio sp. Tun.PSC04-5.I4]SDQ21715.1 polysaccharide export outer membrane protein [Pseudovibrio sp. Tun.PSC04-5.I4]